MAEDQSDKTPQADKIVRNHAFGSVAAGLLPIPLLDAGILAGVQLHMVKKLADLYDVEFSEQRANAIIGSLVGVSAAVSLSSILCSLVPGSRVLLGISGLTISAASTYALGQVFTKHFASGGTFMTFDDERAKKDYNEGLVEAQKEADQSYAGVKP